MSINIPDKWTKSKSGKTIHRSAGGYRLLVSIANSESYCVIPAKDAPTPDKWHWRNSGGISLTELWQSFLIWVSDDNWELCTTCKDAVKKKGYQNCYECYQKE